MGEFYVVLRRPDDKYKDYEKVLGIYPTADEANLHLERIRGEIDNYRAAYDRYIASCKFLGEAWVRDSGLAYRTFSVSEIFTGGEELYREIQNIAIYANATTTTMFVSTINLIADIKRLRKKYNIWTPIPDWPSEPKYPSYVGSTTNYTVLKLEIE